VSHRFFAGTTALMVMLAVLFLAGGPVAGQARWPADTPKLPMARTWTAYKAKLPPYSPPRAPDGVPNLQGVWGGPGGAGGDEIEEHEYVDVTTPPQESFVADTPDGKIPYTPWALAKQKEHRAGLARGWPGESGRLHADPASFCFTTIGPRGSGGVEIIQRPGYVIMVNANKHRVIPTDGRPHPNQRLKLWMGSSRGRWDGDTLVIDVRNLNGKHWLDSVGNFYSENTRMVERWRMADANTIDYELIVEDPTIYTRPWTMNYPVRRAGTGGTDPRTGKYNWRDVVTRDDNPNANEVWEDSCNEGNGHHIEGIRSIGYKWFRGVTLPQ
jgi:hypothetical protein